MLRSLTIAVVFFTLTPLLIAVQWLLEKIGGIGWGTIGVNYYRALRGVLRIRVRVVGTPVRDRAVLIVSNHVSWADIVVIGSLAPVAYVSKSEIANWPVVGIAAKSQRTVFVDRSRRQQTGAVISEIAQRLAGGTSVVLFAEGTSSDGNRVLPFRSALVGAIRDACTNCAPGQQILIQPMSICYTRTQGIPMGRQHRPLVAWYGDLDFMPHIRTFIERGAVDAVVTFGDPIPGDPATDRKSMARILEGAVRRITAATLRGGPPPVHAAR